MKRKVLGVYALTVDDEIIYIGSTIRSFEERINEHRKNMENNSKELKVYDILRECKKQGKEIIWKIIVDCNELKVNKILTIEDVESMELGFIDYFKPKGNVAGIKTEFKYKI